MADPNYVEAFQQEARDQLDNLNDGILNLEKEPSNADYVNQVFRACHTLKGNAAMMGFSHFSELAHKMENVLGKVRDNELQVTQDIVDKLLDGADALEGGLETIKENGNEEGFDQTQLIEDLKGIVTQEQKSSSGEQGESAIKSQLQLNEEQQKQADEQKQAGLNVFRVVMEHNPENKLKGPKTQIFMKKTGDLYKKVIYSYPSFDEIKDGNVGEGFEIVFATDQSKEQVQEQMNCIAEMTPHVLDPDEEFTLPENLAGGSSSQAEGAQQGSTGEGETQKQQASQQQESADQGNEGGKDSTQKGEKKQESKQKTAEEKFAKSIQSIKVDVKSLDKLVNMIGELLISNMRLNEISKKFDSTELRDVVNNIDMLTSNIQEEVMEQRMVPVGQIFSRFPRLVRDLSRRQNKTIELNIEGEEIELDRNILDEIGEPMVHLMRNSIDHGIETPEERQAAGKSQKGTLNLTARREKNTAVIEVQDDGKGIDTDKVIQKAINNGVTSEEEAEKMSRQKKLMLIFHPGLSTKQEVTEVSGRGVGMDVVLNKVKKLGGNVKIDSEVGKGTTIQLYLPLTLAIISSLIIKVEEEKYAIPLNNVVETIDLKEENIQTIQGNEVLVLRGEEIPIIRLGEFFGNEAKKKDIYPAVIIEESDRKAAYIVDEIINQQPILIKNLHQLVRGVKGIAGATILGDGLVCLILDVASIET